MIGTKYYIRKSSGSFISSLGGDVRLFDSITHAKLCVGGRKDLIICEYSPNILHLDCIEQLKDIGFSFDVQGDSVYVTLDSLMTGPIMEKLKWLTDGDHYLNRDFGIMAEFTFVRQISQIDHEITEYRWEVA